MKHFDEASTRWPRSGLMHLSGPVRGAPLLPAFDAMSTIDALRRRCEDAARALGAEISVDPRLLTERAALARLRRRGQVSCNGSCRLIEASDGWLAVNLPRPSDFELLPAWLLRGAGTDPWRSVARVVRENPAAELAARAGELGIAASQVPAGGASEDPILPCPDPASGGREACPPGKNIRGGTKPLVIDLSALWAGPLCAQLLRQAGARVIRIESTRRPDPTRESLPSFHDRLNAGKESVALDFTSQVGRARLRSLLQRADVVIGSARPRAFEQLGIAPDEMLARNPQLIWVAITAYGWHDANALRVGFGDDAAAAAGLLVWSADGRPMFAGDAIADPLAGIAAAAAAFETLASGRGGLVDISLHKAAQSVAGARRLTMQERGRLERVNGAWRVRTQAESCTVAKPRARPWREAARPFSADTSTILEEFT